MVDCTRQPGIDSYYIISCQIVPDCLASTRIRLLVARLYQTAWHRLVLYYWLLGCTRLSGIDQYYTICCQIVPDCLASSGIILFVARLCQIVWHHLVLYYLLLDCTRLSGIIWYYIICCQIVSDCRPPVELPGIDACGIGKPQRRITGGETEITLDFTYINVYHRR